ncbi:hypothetical protein CYMTET_38283 [Cymbomonas tetramitiformis]|uniref:Uncharacterized protein n=1 Tax=Cymbomonas tetramitiformis TaxID=36881 RepID=A0AAE0CEK0_9CHLO|nr:hypothetical protein CYMTET_38283 [Cymbomonas tetramitiformis]
MGGGSSKSAASTPQTSPSSVNLSSPRTGRDFPAQALPTKPSADVPASSSQTVKSTSATSEAKESSSLPSHALPPIYDTVDEEIILPPKTHNASVSNAVEEETEDSEKTNTEDRTDPIPWLTVGVDPMYSHESKDLEPADGAWKVLDIDPLKEIRPREAALYIKRSRLPSQSLPTTPRNDTIQDAVKDGFESFEEFPKPRRQARISEPGVRWQPSIRRRAQMTVKFGEPPGYKEDEERKPRTSSSKQHTITGIFDIQSIRTTAARPEGLILPPSRRPSTDTDETWTPSIRRRASLLPENLAKALAPPVSDDPMQNLFQADRRATWNGSSHNTNAPENGQDTATEWNPDEENATSGVIGMGIRQHFQSIRSIFSKPQ